MTDNDLSRMLDAAVPEPRATLSADALVRRARRRRTVRTSALTAFTAVAVVGGITAANGLVSRPDPVVAASPEPTGLAASAVATFTGDPRRWPEDMRVTTRCAEHHPADLTKKTFAFEGTVTDVSYDQPLREDGVRVAITFDVDRVFEGAPRTTVTLNTWDHALPARSYGLDGIRVLAATDETYELGICGFTRRYSDATAELWARELGPRTEYCGLDLERLDDTHGARYVPEYAGMAVDDAVRLAESRRLTVRLIGDGSRGQLRDLRLDRVNLCDVDGKVTAAAIY